MGSKRGGILEKIGRKAKISSGFIVLDFRENNFYSSYIQSNVVSDPIIISALQSLMWARIANSEK
jgi:hypothetical protein